MSLFSRVFKIQGNEFIQLKTMSLVCCRPVRPNFDHHVTDLLTWKADDMYPKTNNKTRNTWARRQINETLLCELMLSTQANSCNANSHDPPPLTTAVSSAYVLLLSVLPSQRCVLSAVRRTPVILVLHRAMLANFFVAWHARIGWVKRSTCLNILESKTNLFKC